MRMTLGFTPLMEYLVLEYFTEGKNAGYIMAEAPLVIAGSLLARTGLKFIM